MPDEKCAREGFLISKAYLDLSGTEIDFAVSTVTNKNTRIGYMN